MLVNALGPMSRDSRVRQPRSSLKYESFLDPSSIQPETPVIRRVEVCRNIAAAVLEDALTVLTTHSPADVIHQETLAWVTSPPDRAHAFGFSNVCDFLGLDPEAVRERIVARRITAPARHRRIGWSRNRMEGVR